MRSERFWKSLIALLAVSLLAACLCATVLAEDGLELEGEIGCAPYVIAGQSLKITLPQAAGATSYEIAFMDVADNAWIARNKIQGNYAAGQVQLPTSGISAGLWPVRVWVRGAQGEKISWERVINVAASAPSSSGVNFVLSRTSAQINEDCLVWIYARDAAGVSLDFGGKDTWNESGECLSGVFSYNTWQETCNFIATAYYANGTAKRSQQRFEMTWEGERVLPEWQTSISDVIDEGGLNVSFDRIDLGDTNVEYDVHVWDVDGDNREVLYQYYRNRVDEGVTDMSSMLEVTGETQNLNMPASALVRGHNYRVWMRAKAVGCKSDGCTAEKIVRYPNDKPVGEGLLTATVWRDGTELDCAERISVGTHEKWYLRLELPEDVTAARFFNGFGYEILSENPDEWRDCQERGYWSRSMDDGWAGRYPLFVQLYTDPVDEDTDLYALDWDNATVTNTLQVEVGYGDSTCDQATLSVPTTVQRGNPLVFTIQDWRGNCGALWYSVSRAGGEEYEGYMVYNPRQTGSYPTAALEPGLYVLWVNSISPYAGLNEYAAYYYFVVTDREAPEDVFIDVSDSELAAHQETAVSAWAPGASEMRLLVKDLSEGRIEERGYWDEADCFGTSLELSPGFNGEADSFDAARPREPVTFEVYAEALFEDGWHQSEPVPVTVSRPEATVYQLSAPMTVREGAPYTFTVTGLDNADNWWWDIYVEKKIQHRDGTDWVTIWRCSANDRAAQTETTFSIPAELLEADSCYRVNVWADGREASGCGLYKDFFVTRSKNPTDGNLRLTIEYNGEEYDGSGGEVLNAPVRADVHMKVTGLGDATALRWYNGCEWHFYEQVENGVAEWDERLDTENVQYFVSACHDAIDWDAYYEQGMDWCEMDLNWGGISNIVRVNVQVDGISAPARVVCAPDDGVVTRGDLLHVTILPPEEDATGYGTEFCAYFRAWDNGEDYRWAEWRSDYFEEWGDGLSFDLRTSELPADRDYSLIVESSAPGYNWRSQRVFDFTVVEPELGDHEMQFIVSNLEWDEEQQTHFAWGGDWISFAAYAPDASRIDVVLHPLDLREDHEDRIWDFYGDCAIGDFDEGWEAPYELYAVAYDEEDNEIARSDTWSVEIRSHGDMEPATVEGDVRTAANEEYRFTVYGLNQLGDNWYDVSVCDEEYDWSQPYEGDGNPSEISRFTRDGWSDEGYENDDGTFTFVIPADKLQTNHFYRINTWVDQTGWRGVGGEFRFFVYDAMSGDVKLRVNGSETEASGMAHSDDFRIEIDAPGATAVRLTIGNGWDYMYDFDPEAGSVVRDSYWFDSGEYVVYAQACYEDFDWDSVCDGSLPWEALAWSAVSENSVYVTVEDKGDAFAAELDQEAYEVTRGELLRFEIVGAGDVDDPRRATNFHAYIVDEDYGWDGSNDASLHADDAEAFPMEVYLSTGYLEPERNYRLIVDSCAPEYAWVSLEVPLTVTEPEGDGVPFVFQVQDNLIDNEEFRFSAYERDASWMEVFAHNVDDGENHDYDPRWEYPGNYVNGRGSLSEGTYRMWAVAHYTDEEGNETGEPRLSDELEVVVGVHGDMQPAQAYGSRVFHVGGDYSFVVYDLHQMGDNWYDIRVRDDFGEWPEGYEGDEDPCEIMRFTRDEYGDGIDEFTIPADMIVPGHRYSINVWVDANGWRGQGSNFWFYACEDGDGYTLRLPGALTEIDEEAFAGVDARMIIVPDGVTSIGERAFADCPNLQVVISPVELPDNALEGCGWEVYVDTPAGE